MDLDSIVNSKLEHSEKIPGDYILCQQWENSYCYDRFRFIL